MTLREAIARTSTTIARRDAELLLQHVLRRDRPWLLAHPEAELSPHDFEQLTDLAARRTLHEPLQYLTGHQEFYGLDLCVTPNVLIPRPETELLVETVLSWVGQSGYMQSLRVLDIGTGSGAIALALAARLPKALLTAVDLSPAALAVARANAERLGLADRVTFAQSDLLDALGTNKWSAEPWDVIVSNPPYVASSELPGMQPEVRDFEPHLALFAGADGLDIYCRLIPQALRHLRHGGLLALEFGFGQRADLAHLLHGWHNVEILDDLAGIPRVARAERP